MSSCVCYGWLDDEYYVIMDYDCLEKLNDKLAVFTTEIDYGLHCDTVYGVCCSFDPKTGHATLSDELKMQVESAYKLWCEKKGLTPKTDGVCYRNVVFAGWEPRHDTRSYTLDF